MGAPWGHLTMGGKYEGKLPGNLRAVAVVQAIVLLGFGAAVLARAQVIVSPVPSWLGGVTWAAVGVSALSLVLNLATPSKWERAVWAPVAFMMLMSSLVVAVGT